jgi:hypothetical protein
MPGAGDPINAAEINRRKGTTSGTSDITAITTTETVTDTVTVSVISGRTYHIKSYFPFTGSVVADRFLIRLREDLTSAGAQITYATADVRALTEVSVETPEADWTASATGSKSFCVTAVRSSGTGSITPKGAASQVRLLTVDLVI